MKLKAHQESRDERGIYDKRNKINDLTGKEWLFSTRSVKTKKFKVIIERKKAYNHNFFDFLPINLIKELFNTFSKPNMTIVDPFCNFGSSALAICQDKNINNYKYFGFNYRDISIIDQQIKNVFTRDVNLFKNSYTQEKQNVSNKCKSWSGVDLVFSELIFSSFSPEKRSKEYKIWSKEVKIFLKSIFSLIGKGTYILLSLQNTKVFNTINHELEYTNNVSKLCNSLEDFNLILKGEIIWKIPNLYVNELKLIASRKMKKVILPKVSMNDKRILVFRREF